jgi:hypothetical protein
MGDEDAGDSLIDLLERSFGTNVGRCEECIHPASTKRGVTMFPES